MELREYLFRNRMTQVKLAHLVDVTPNHIYGIVNRRTKPSKWLAMQISKATDGQVTFEELMAKKLEANSESVQIYERLDMIAHFWTPQSFVFRLVLAG